MNHMNMTARAHRAVVATILVFVASPALATIPGRAVPLEELALTVDLVCKATVVADRPVADEWFEAIPGYEVHETELRIVSIVKGNAPGVIRFRHYAESLGLRMNLRQSYSFVGGRTYLLFAAQGADGTYRQWSK